jgi:hypothetical protein
MSLFSEWFYRAKICTTIERMASFSTDDHEGDTKARISFGMLDRRNRHT